MTVFASPDHEGRFAKQVTEHARWPARTLRICNLLIWGAGMTALYLDSTSSATAAKLSLRLLRLNLTVCSCFALLELYAYRLLRKVVQWERYEPRVLALVWLGLPPLASGSFRGLLELVGASVRGSRCRSVWL